METLLNAAQLSCPVSDSSHVAAARRAAADLATRQGLDATRAGELAIVVTEAASNILKHAGHGEILMRPLQSASRTGVEIIAIDSGAGMASLSASLQDGRTTAGSYGVGLGAMRRLSASFDAYSAPGQGTVIYLTVWQHDGGAPLQEAELPLDIGLVCLPMAGETACGDSWGVACGATAATVIVADGLGHGPLAQDASRLAVQTALANPTLTASVLLEDMHGAMGATRGAAVAVARIDMLAEQLLLAGVGNIACHVWSAAGRRQMVSHNGIVGSNMRKVQEFSAPWDSGAMMILHSDGLGTRWNLDDYRGLSACHPAIIAAVLYRDFSRGRDDVTVLVVRDRQGAAP